MSVWDTPERSALREMVARFTAAEIVPYLAEWEDVGEVPRALHRAAGSLGLLALGFPSAAGGAGDILDQAVVNEQIILSGGSSGLCAALFTHGIGAVHIAAHGDPRQVAAYVAPALRGERICALAVTEPGTGSDVAAIATRAVRDGDDYVVDGVKTYITSGARADFVTVAVRTGGPGHRGVSLLVVDTDRPGFRVGARLAKLGWHCSDTAELVFDGVRVPAANLVGAEGTGFRQIMAHFQGERLLLAVQAVATARRCVDLTVEYAKTRRSFGRPLAENQVVRHRIADMARRSAAARAFVWDVLSRAHTPAEVAMAKNTAVEACDFVVDAAVQVHGGVGYMRGTEVERHYRDARIMGIGGGTTEIMNELIAAGLGLTAGSSSGSAS